MVIHFQYQDVRVGLRPSQGLRVEWIIAGVKLMDI